MALFSRSSIFSLLLRSSISPRYTVSRLPSPRNGIPSPRYGIGSALLNPQMQILLPMANAATQSLSTEAASNNSGKDSTYWKEVLNELKAYHAKLLQEKIELEKILKLIREQNASLLEVKAAQESTKSALGHDKETVVGYFGIIGVMLLLLQILPPSKEQGHLDPKC